jgi:flavin reductase (DIM6/NTAB) family NADH-FMN oxidoreductase RutF
VVVVGCESTVQTLANLERERECVIKFRKSGLMDKIEALALLIRRNPLALHKADRFRYEPRKFEAAGLTLTPAQIVRPPQIRECPMQHEVRVTATYRLQSKQGELYRVVEAQVEHIHAIPEIKESGTQHIDMEHWGLPL